MSFPKISLLSTLTLLAVIGCSVLNAPEDLNLPGDGDGDNSGGTGGSGLGGNPGDGDGDATGGSLPMSPTSGLIVVTGTDTTDDDRVLLALNASTGKELSRDKLKAVTVAYDEAPGRFVWYVFTSASTSPGANTLAELQIRRWNDDSETWSTISKTSSLPPPLLQGQDGAAPGIRRPTALFRPIVLNKRLAYVSQTVDAGTPVQSVTILDTTDFEDVSVLESLVIPDGVQLVGLVGRRGTELDEQATGGSLSMMVAQDCDEETNACNLEARPVTVGASVNILSPNNFGTFAGIPAFASSPVLPDSVDRPFDSSVASLGAYAIAYEPSGMDPRWWGFDPANPASKDSPSSLPSSAGDSFSGLAVWECRAAAVASTSGSSDDNLTAIHLANASVINSALADSGRDILIEPFRGNLITMRGLDDTQPVLRAFQIEVLSPGTGSERIALAERTQWSAPKDVQPISMAVRLPESPTCD